MKIENTDLPPGLIEAYKNTDFKVMGEKPFTIKVDVYNENLQLIYRSYSVKTACFITAYNPFSETVSKTNNQISQQRLLEDLEKSKFSYFDGIGSDPSGEWQGEPSFLILGISKKSAQKLGTKFRQNAIVWCDTDCTAELLLLR